MKKTIVSTAIILFLISTLLGQKSSIVLTFSSDNNGNHLPLDSILIKNLTQDASVMLYAPDTSYSLVYTGMNEMPAYNNDLLSLSQNFPNPSKDKTEFNLSMGEKGTLEICVFNLLGKQITAFQRKLDKGTHHFSFNPGGEKVCLLSATAFGFTQSIKMYSTSDVSGNCEINYLGLSSEINNFKSAQFVKDFPFDLGDDLLFVGYNELGESGLLDSPEESQTYIFQFATNIPCIGTPTVDYEGQVYNTIQIYSQCWLKENLNVGQMIPASQSQTNNNAIEKYCPMDNEYYCNTFAGALYQWSEMMNYTYEPGAQGICPDGWHIPTDMDWQLLEGAVDSVYGIGNPEWASTNWRGSDAGGNLKQTGTSFWESPNTGATDAFGFSALPGGYVVQDEYWGGGWKGYFWSSDIAAAYFRNMDWNQLMIKRGGGAGLAISVRCIKD